MTESYKYVIVSLRQVSERDTAEERNLGLSSGVTYLPNQPEIPFELGWKTTTPYYQLPDPPKTININNINISQVMAVYLLLQGGWMTKVYENKQIGRIILEFSDGGSLETILTAGENIRDWSLDKPDAIRTKTSEKLQEAWVGQAEDGNGWGRIDMLILDLPCRYRSAKLINIHILGSSSEPYSADSRNPCIHLLAITVKCHAPNAS